jgi:hypothetical protein
MEVARALVQGGVPATDVRVRHAMPKGGSLKDLFNATIHKEVLLRAGDVSLNSTIDIQRNGNWTWTYRVHEHGKIYGDHYGIWVFINYRPDNIVHCFFKEGTLGALLGESDYGEKQSGNDPWMSANWWMVLEIGTTHQLHQKANAVELTEEIVLAPLLVAGYLLQQVNVDSRPPEK